MGAEHYRHGRYGFKRPRHACAAGRNIGQLRSSLQEPIKFEFIVNLKAAQSFGLTMPSGVLSITDEVIEQLIRAIILDCCDAHSISEMGHSRRT